MSHPSTHKADYTCRSAKELIHHGLSETNPAEQKAGCCSHLTCGHWAFIHGKMLFSVQSTRPWVTKHKSWSTVFTLLGTKSLLRNMPEKCQAMSYTWWNDMETMGFVLRVKWQNTECKYVWTALFFPKPEAQAHNTNKKNHLHLFCLWWSRKQQSDMFCLLSRTYWCVAHQDESILWQRHWWASLYQQSTTLCQRFMV